MASLTPAARADEVAPLLEGQDLRATAALVLAALKTPELPPGVYLAVDPTQSDALAQAACDDDGDYVVLVSDGMLRLAAEIARLSLYDDTNHTAMVEAYATFLAANQVSGKRILPPAAGSFLVPSAGPAPPERLLALLAVVVERALARIRAHDLSCAHPTATRESGDDRWTTAEETAAAELAKKIYPAPRSADADFASANILRRFFARFTAASAFRPSYAVTHPEAAR